MIVYAKKSKTTLNSAKQVGPIYHFTTTYKKLISILTDKALKSLSGRTEQDHGGEDKYFVSFTRNAGFIKSGRPFGIKIDGDRLSENASFTPFNFFAYYDHISGATYEEDENGEIKKDGMLIIVFCDAKDRKDEGIMPIDVPYNKFLYFVDLANGNYTIRDGEESGKPVKRVIFNKPVKLPDYGYNYIQNLYDTEANTDYRPKIQEFEERFFIPKTVKRNSYNYPVIGKDGKFIKESKPGLIPLTYWTGRIPETNPAKIAKGQYFVPGSGVEKSAITEVLVLKEVWDTLDIFKKNEIKSFGYKIRIV